MDLDSSAPKPAKAAHIITPQQAQIDHLTALASNLLSMGEADIYDKTYEHLLRAVRGAGNVEPDWVPPSADVKYEYKWDVPEAGAGADSRQVFGPFGAEEMKSWYDAAYFGATGEKVKVRVTGGEWGEWDEVIE